MWGECPVPCLAIRLCGCVKRALDVTCGSVQRVGSTLGGAWVSLGTLNPDLLVNFPPPLTISTWVHTWLKCCVWDCCDSSCDTVTLSKAFSPLPPAPYDFYRALEEDAADVGQPPSYPQSFSSPSEPVKVPAHSIKYSHSPQLPVVTLQRHKAIRKTAVPIM